MSISRGSVRPVRPTLRRLALEAIGLAAVFVFLPTWAGVSPRVVPHPGWIAVFVLAARYGRNGFFMGLIAVAGAAVVGLAVTGAGLAYLWSRLASGSSLVAFGACLAVSWIGSWHLRREADLSAQMLTLSTRAADAEATIETLREVVATLRARVDRASTSLSFLRNAAERLEGTDLAAAAEGAADLALARTGASAATVVVGVNGSRRLLAVRDARGIEGLAPLAHAELSVSIRDGLDRVGVIGLWGISGGKLDDATAHDLGVIASWLARAITDHVGHPERTTARGLKAS
jgi:uncharacterized coiled-coil protein SlyX